jgi:hypothetical protein
MAANLWDTLYKNVLQKDTQQWRSRASKLISDDITVPSPSNMDFLMLKPLIFPLSAQV